VVGAAKNDPDAQQARSLQATSFSAQAPFVFVLHFPFVRVLVLRLRLRLTFPSRPARSPFTRTLSDSDSVWRFTRGARSLMSPVRPSGFSSKYSAPSVGMRTCAQQEGRGVGGTWGKGGRVVVVGALQLM